MDSITQGLLGATTAQLGFRQRIGRDATWVAAVAGIVPDLDIFITPLLSLSGVEVDPQMRLQVHRGLSHSLLFAPLLALPVAALWWWLRRRVFRGRANSETNGDRLPPTDHTKRTGPARFWLLYLCVFVAVVTHPLLDWCTSYGTQLLMPLTNVRYTIDAAPIIDLFYTAGLIVTLLVCWATRKFRGPGRRATLVIGWVGFLATTGYLATGRVMHDWAIRKAVAIAGEGKVLAADAYPMIGTIFLWRTVVETEDEWIVTRIHHFRSDPPAPEHQQRAPRQDNIWIRRARHYEGGRIFNWFANGRIRAEYTNVDGLHVVTLHDMRYGESPQAIESLWPARVTFDRQGNVVSFGRMRRGPRGDFRKFAGRVWYDMWNP